MRQYIATLRTEETWKVNSDTEKNSFLFFTRSYHGNGDRAPQLQRSVDPQPQGTKSCTRAGPAFQVLLALMGIIIRLSSVSWDMHPWKFFLMGGLAFSVMLVRTGGGKNSSPDSTGNVDSNWTACNLPKIYEKVLRAHPLLSQLRLGFSLQL